MATIVFVPGAWITPDFYQPFLNACTAAGYPVHYADYPSLDPVDPTVADCKTDTEVIRKTLHKLVEEDGRDIILVMHSYAGMPGAAAALGLAKSQRLGQGQAGGVVGMVFLAAFLVPEGLSCAGLQGGNLPPWILLDKPAANLNVPADVVADFAADVDPALVKDIGDKIKPHSTLAFNSPQPAPAWADTAFQGRLAFIVTTRDPAVPKEAQYGMMAATQQKWIVKEIECSHCAPFIDRIEETVRLVDECSKEFNGNSTC
ncbi:alpha/beta-hydrolase [Aspergillus sclerotiicarbonarius CBS 121057]|uniref:Alpha/beta-hydrolase n=1 Tax=Aspergillus sclerotiicarbonarius (strain CBS 121057 / IBT 28362) TaxID=1448318 RepID=A0A319E3U1_ASPSB|nr:alpha/beta-hydrolase [Aspergillus sclerotiicarbonarius CBS 121057]